MGQCMIAKFDKEGDGGLLFGQMGVMKEMAMIEKFFSMISYNGDNCLFFLG